MSFVVQRLHPRLLLGRYLGAASSKLPAHSQQSRWDSACAMHCLAMVLQIAGLIADPSGIATRRRRLEAKLWRKTIEVFPKGITFAELAAFIAELDGGLRTKLLERGAHREAAAFVQGELARQRLVICSWREVGALQHNHAVLAIGVAGVQRKGQLKPNTLLLLDPAEGQPTAMATCNAQLEYAERESGKLWRYARYTTASETLCVVLNGAISIEVGKPKKPP